MLKWSMKTAGRLLAAYLLRPAARYRSFAVTPSERLLKVLRPCDVLLVEGDLRISVAVKYLTQSTWSHAALFVGDALDPPPDGERPVLVEADPINGVTAVPLSKYRAFNTRICRPVGLTASDQEKVLAAAVASLGKGYDLRNVFDLARYLMPQPPVPARWRRRMLALGSGDPTRAICSTLIAQAFQQVRYPILPEVRAVSEAPLPASGVLAHEPLHIRHHSLFAPRDFDLSPYFEIVKPTLVSEFDYKTLAWDDGPIGSGARAARPRG
ncbi:MAG: lipo-like protein [Alphaproteobacteria bacterium]